MAYDDKDDTKFPTRFGQATGHANERTMLDELGGANGIRHRQRMGADGVTTHVKTRGGHPHFWNEPLPGSDEEPVSPIYMDSGTVDLLSVNPANPLSYLAAPLYYSNDQKAAYTAEKLLGKITPPETTNIDPPVDTEPGESFTPVIGGDLLGKKDCAAKCPPSMFTGKARLYAQAQLGAPLKKWGWTLDLPEGQAPRWVHDNTGFVLDINVGVYTDDTNKHWLISVSGSGAMVTPLKPSKSAKLLVPELSDPTDRTKIEAYILAHSIPGGASESFFTTISGLPPPYMLGYGWKFNWDGSRADIIRHVPASPEHTSTHYRLSISRNTGVVSSIESNRWSFSIEAVEGPVLWHNSMYGDVICSPAWVFNKLEVFGTLYGGHIGNAPVYCFYKEDGNLEILRYSGSGGETNVKYSGISEPASWSWVYDWTADVTAGNQFEFGTLGLSGGYGERRTRTIDPTITGFSSLYSGQCVESSQSYIYTSYYISSKSLNGANVGDIGESSGHIAYEEEGVVTGTGFSLLKTTSDNIPVYTSSNETTINTGTAVGSSIGTIIPYLIGADFSREQYSGSHVENRETLLVVPFHDAESVYMYAKKNTQRHATGTGGSGSASLLNGTFYKLIKHVFQFDTDPVTYAYFDCHYYYGSGASYQPSAPSGDLDPINENSDIIETSSLITRSGVFDFVPPISMSIFFIGNYIIDQNFYTHSSINGTMYGFGASNPEGISKIFDSPPPFIGWA